MTALAFRRPARGELGLVGIAVTSPARRGKFQEFHAGVPGPGGFHAGRFFGCDFLVARFAACRGVFPFQGEARQGQVLEDRRSPGGGLMTRTAAAIFHLYGELPPVDILMARFASGAAEPELPRDRRRAPVMTIGAEDGHVQSGEGPGALLVARKRERRR